MEQTKEQQGGPPMSRDDAGAEGNGSTSDESLCSSLEDTEVGAQRSPSEDSLFVSETASSSESEYASSSSSSTVVSRLPDEGYVDQYETAKRELTTAKTAFSEADDRSWARWNAREKKALQEDVEQLKISARYSRAKADHAIKSAEEFMPLGAKMDVALDRAVKSHHRAKVVLAKRIAAAPPAASGEAPAAATAAAAVGVGKRKRSLHGDADITMSKVVKAQNESAGDAARSRMHGDDATSDGEGQHVASAKVDAQRNGLAKARWLEATLASKLTELQQLKSTNAQQALADRARAKALNNIAIRDARLWKEAETAVKESPETEAYYTAVRDLRRKKAALADAEREVLALECIFLKVEHAASRGEIGSKRVREATWDAEEAVLKRRKKMKEEADSRPKPMVLPFLEGINALTPARAWMVINRQIMKVPRLVGRGRAKEAERGAELQSSTPEARGKQADVFEA